MENISHPPSRYFSTVDPFSNKKTIFFFISNILKSYKKSIVLKTQTGSKIANKFKMLAIIDKNHVTKHFKMMTLFNYMSILQRNWGYDSKGYTKCLNVEISFASNSFTIKSNMKNVYNVELPCFGISALQPYWITWEISLNGHVTNAMLYTRVDTVNKHRVLRFYMDIIRIEGWQRFSMSYAGLLNTTDLICVVNAYTFTYFYFTY